jgi:hypothetical protein
MRFVVRGALLRAFAFFLLSSFFQTIEKKAIPSRESPCSCSVFPRRACASKSGRYALYPPFFSPVCVGKWKLCPSLSF